MISTLHLRSGCSLLALALAACHPERAFEPALVGPPSTMVGQLPNNPLLTVDVIEYRSTDGGLAVDLGVNRGLLTAAQTGLQDQGTFAVELTVELSNSSDQSASPPPLLALLSKQVLAEPRPDPLVLFEVVLGWDGTDDAGASMTGPTTAYYTARIVQVLENGAISQVGFPVMGTLFFDIP